MSFCLSRFFGVGKKMFFVATRSFPIGGFFVAGELRTTELSRQYLNGNPRGEEG